MTASFPSPFAWIARRFGPVTGGILAAAAGGGVVISGWGGAPYFIPVGSSQWVGIGAIYVGTGLGAVALASGPSIPSFRRLARTTVAVLVAGYLCILVHYAMRGGNAGRFGVEVVDSLVPTLEVFLRTLPAGLFTLYGAADGASERRYARSAIAMAFAFYATVELLAQYTGNVPVLAVVVVALTTTLGVVLGTPLYLLGATIRQHRRDRVLSGDLRPSP